MQLDRRDLMLLRLAGMYRWLPYDGIGAYGFDGLTEDIDTLATTGLFHIARSRKFCKLTTKGYDLLKRLGSPYQASPHKPYDNDRVLQRRLEVVTVMLTTLRAGIDPFRDHVDALNGQPVFLPAFVLRTGTGNLMNAASCIGFGHWGDKAYMLQYTGPDSRGMYMTNELSHFHNLSSVFDADRQSHKAMIFAGPGYHQVHKRLQKRLPSDNRAGKAFVDYADAYDCSDMPIHLLSCDETGARQLAVMCEPNYNARIARVSFENWQPVDYGIPEADGCVDGIPLIIAVDMDIRRIEQVISAAKRLGCREVYVAALKEQMRGFLMEILPMDGRITPLSICCI